MNGSLLGTFAALLSVLLWLAARRRPQPLLASTSTEAVAALNRAQLTLVQQQAEAAEAAAPAALPLPAPGDARGRQAFLAQLQAQFAGDQAQRLAAMQLAHRWGDRASLPLLRLGLRDGDLAVRGEAALAIARFRGRTAAAPAGAQLPLPRNVARTR